MDLSLLEIGSTIIGSAKTAFFFFYLKPAIKQEDFDNEFNKYLEKFDVKDELILKDASLRFYLNRIKTLQSELKAHFYSALNLTVEKYNDTRPIQVNEYLKIISENKLELERLMLIIKPECVKNINKTANQEYDYCLYRGYWIEWDFKKKLKFSVSLGKVDDVMEDGEIKGDEKEKGVKVIREKLIEEYKKYYLTE
jgi:hypothetical protein